MYWSDHGMIERAEMDGEARMTVALLKDYWDDAHDSRGLALDAKMNRLYFVSYDLYSLMYIDVDSSGHGSVRTLLRSSIYFWSPRGIALDDQFVYWNEYITENVYRINKTRYDGLFEVIASGIYSPRGMVIKKGNATRQGEYNCYY